VLLELKRADLQGMDALRSLGRECPYTNVVVLTSYPDLGRFRIVRPRGELILSKNGSNFDGVGRPATVDRQQGQVERRQPVDLTLTVEVVDAAFQIRKQGATQPVVDIQNVSLTAKVEHDGNGRVLVVSPFQPLNMPD
jgi:hypothetical protein